MVVSHFLRQFQPVGRFYEKSLNINAKILRCDSFVDLHDSMFSMTYDTNVPTFTERIY